MGTNYIAPTWRQPENTNKDKSSNYNIAFDGSESINCGIPTLFNGSTTATISAWVKFRNVTDPDYTSIVSIGTASTTADLFLRVVPQGSQRRIESGITNSFARAGTDDFSDIPADTWTHFMCFIDRDRNDGSDVAIFLNGQEIFTQDINSTMANPITQDLLLGSGSGWGNLNGNLSHIALWNTDQRANASSIWNEGTPLNLMALNHKPDIYYQLGDNSNPTATAGYPNISVGEGSVFSFTQSNSYPQTIDFGNTFSTSNKITFAIWFNSTATIGSDTGYTILSRGNISAANGCFALMVRNNNEFQCWFYDDSGTSPNPILGTGTNFTNYNDGNWHHIAITIDGTLAQPALKMYLDGALASSATSPNTGINQPSASVNQLLLGQRQYTYTTLGAKYSNLCTFDDVLELTGAQSITSLYNNGVPPDISSYNNLTGWWKLDQTASWEADSTGNWQIPDALSSYPQSFNFNDTTDAINVGGISLGTVHTINFWVNFKPPYGTRAAYILSSGSENGWVVYANNGGTLYYKAGSSQYYSGTMTAPTAAGVGEWHNITITRNGANINFYQNGNTTPFATTSTFAGASTPLGDIDFISADRSYGSSIRYSNFTFYDIEFSPSQVSQIYNNGVPLTSAIATSNLKAWYKLDDTANYINYPQNLTFTPDYWSIDPGNITLGATEALNFSGGYQNLPGTYEGIEFNDTPLTDNKSIMSFWYNPTKDTNDGSYIFHNYSGGTIGISFFTSSFNIYADPTTSGSHMMRYYLPATRTGWHHLVIYMNQGSGSTVDLNNTDNLRIYVDGSELSVGLVLGDVSASPVRTEANRLGWTTGGNFEGFQFSNLSLLVGDNAVLSAIPTLYNGGTPGDISSLNPTWWYKLNSSDVSFPTSTPPTSADNVFTVIDSSGNGNTTTGPFYYAKSLTKPHEVPSIQTVNVVANQGISSGMTEQNLVNNNVSTLNGESSGMDTTNLVTSNLTKKQPFSSYSVYFDGVNDYFDLGTSIDLGLNNTISMWLNFDVDYNSVLLGEGSYAFDYLIYAKRSNPYNSGISYVFYRIGSTAIEFPNIETYLTPSVWHNLIFVRTGDTVKSYVNGSLTDTISGFGTSTNTKFDTIGAKPAGSSFNLYMKGKMDELAAWNTTLSQSAVTEIYNSGAPNDLTTLTNASNTNLKAWYKF